MRSPLSDQNGIALILMLWVLTLLSVIVAEFCHSMRAEVNITGNFKEDTQALYVSEAATARVLLEILKLENPGPFSIGGAREDEPPFRVNIDMPAVAFAGGYYRVRVDNESGKVNLNYTDGRLLRLLLDAFPLDELTRKTIADSILDWRDRDDLHRPNGAEDDYYQALPKPYACKDGNFETVDELLLVRGVTPELFNSGLKDLFTVYGEKPPPEKQQTAGESEPPTGPQKTLYDYNKININAASPGTLLALPGMTRDLAEKVAAYRREKDVTGAGELAGILGAETYGRIRPFIGLQTSPYYTIHAMGAMKSGASGPEILMTIKMDKKMGFGYKVIQRMEN